MIATLLIGCNIGDREAAMRRVLPCIEKRLGPILASSALHETEPFGFQSAERFLNQALQIDTSLSPDDLLKAIWQIEQLFGKERGDAAEELKKFTARKEGKIGFVDRSMDIDILFYDDLILSSPLLTIPHKELSKRRFVLEPLSEIAGEMIHPVLKKTINQLLGDLNEHRSELNRDSKGR